MAVARRHPELELPFPASGDLIVYPDPERLIADGRVDAIVAVTPPVLYPPICLAAAQARKPLLVEKPLAPTAELAQTMVDATTRASIPLMVAHTLRFNASLLAFRDLLPKLGAVRELSVTLAVPARPRPAGNPGFLGRGPLLDLGVHVVDLARWLLGDDIDQVRCRLEPACSDDPEEKAEMEVRLKGGCRGILRIGWGGAERVGRAEAVGSTGRAQVDWGACEVMHTFHDCPPVRLSYEDRPTILETLRGFLRALTDGAPMPVPAEDGLAAVRLIDACYESARRGQVVIT